MAAAQARHTYLQGLLLRTYFSASHKEESFKKPPCPHTLQRTARTLWRPNFTETCAEGSYMVNEVSAKKAFLFEELLILVRPNWPVQNLTFSAADALERVHGPVWQQTSLHWQTN